MSHWLIGKLILFWHGLDVISSATGETKFKITETKIYVPVVTLSTEDNAKLLQQLKSSFKRTINWNKYESSVKTFAQNRYLNYLINPSFQGVNRLFVLSFENEANRKLHSTYYLPKAEIKDYNVMIDGKNFFDQTINSMTKTYENILKNCYRSRGWLYNWLYFRLFLFQKSLQNDCNKFK